MRTLVACLLLIVTLLVVPAVPSPAWSGHGGGGHHGGGHHGGGWHGSGWYGGGWHGSVYIGAPWWDPFYPYPYAYGYYPQPYATYPPAVVDGPTVYIEQQVAPSEAPAYWYYCASAKAYYPTVQKCREAWIKVPPAPW